MNARNINKVSDDIEVSSNSGRLESVSGDVSCYGDNSGEMETVSGDVRIDGKNVNEAVSVSGDVIVATNDKGARVKNVLGDIKIGGNAGSVETVSGNVKVRENNFGQVSSTSGSVDVGGTNAGSISTKSGSVFVKSNLGKINTVSGTVQIKDSTITIVSKRNMSFNVGTTNFISVNGNVTFSGNSKQSGVSSKNEVTVNGVTFDFKTGNVVQSGVSLFPNSFPEGEFVIVKSFVDGSVLNVRRTGTGEYFIIINGQQVVISESEIDIEPLKP